MLTNQFAVEVRWSRQDFFKLGAGYVRSILRRYGPSVFSKTYGMAMNPKTLDRNSLWFRLCFGGT